MRRNPSSTALILAGFAAAGVVSWLMLRKPSLRSSLLQAARLDLEAGIKEDGENTGPMIAKYFAGSGVAPPANWCALAVRYWLAEAARLSGRAVPIPGSPGAKDTMAQLEKAGLWVPKENSNLAAIPPGSIVVWHRGEPGAWTGHIGIVESTGPGGAFTTIEGNSGPAGDRVARKTRALDDPNLLGFGVLPA